MHGESITKELIKEIDNGKGCIIFDIGCYYVPYLCVLDKVKLRLSIDGMELTDCKLNHRYPNKCYTTISKKTGRNVSKIGYPYFVEPKDFKKQLKLQLDIELVRVTNDETKVINTTTIILPIQLNLDVDRPVSNLTIHYVVDRELMKMYSIHDYQLDTWSNDREFVKEQEHGHYLPVSAEIVNNVSETINLFPSHLNDLHTF